MRNKKLIHHLIILIHKITSILLSNSLITYSSYTCFWIILRIKKKRVEKKEVVSYPVLDWTAENFSLI